MGATYVLKLHTISSHPHFFFFLLSFFTTHNSETVNRQSTMSKEQKLNAEYLREKL